MITEREPTPDKMNKELLNEPEDSIEPFKETLPFKEVLRYTQDHRAIELYSNKENMVSLAQILIDLLNTLPAVEKKEVVRKYIQ